MPNTKVRRKSLLESYLETVPLGPDLESFRGRDEEDSVFCRDSEEKRIGLESPLNLLFFKNAEDEVGLLKDTKANLVTANGDDVAETPGDCTWSGQCSANDEDIVDEGYNSSQQHQELSNSNDSSNSEEESEKGKEDVVSKMKNKAITTPLLKAGTPAKQPCDEVEGQRGLSQLAQSKRAKLNFKRFPIKDGKAVTGTERVSKQPASSKGVYAAFSLPNGRSTSRNNLHITPTVKARSSTFSSNGTKSVSSSDHVNDVATAISSPCKFQSSSAAITPNQCRNYTTTKFVSHNNSVMLGSAGQVSLNSGLSQDPFVDNSKEMTSNKLTSVVHLTIENSQAAMQINGKDMKRNIKPEDDKPLECKQNAQDVKEIHKNRKISSDLQIEIDLNESKKKFNARTKRRYGVEGTDFEASLKKHAIARPRSSYFVASTNPTQNHDKVKLEGTDEENIKGCVVGKKESTGANITTAQGKGSRVMEKGAPSSSIAGSVKQDSTKKKHVKIETESEDTENKDYSSIGKQTEGTDVVLREPLTEPSCSEISHEGLPKEIEVELEENIEFASLPKLFDVVAKVFGEDPTCSNSLPTLEDIPGEEHNLKHWIDEELIRYINYEFPGVEALCEASGRSDESSKSNQLDLPVQEIAENQLTMENVRLQKVLLEVEQARSGTVKALLQVNAVLNKVQGENMKLEGDLKSMVQEREFLRETLSELKKKATVDEGGAFAIFKGLYENIPGEEEYVIDRQRREELEQNMKIFLESTKREKRDLLQALAKSTNRAESAQRDAEKLRIQFKKVKEQLEVSNATFNKILKHNLKATQKLEEELQNALNEKKSLLENFNNNSANKKELDALREELQQLQTNLQDTHMERDQLTKKVAHLEKQKKDLKEECEELQEQIDHTQEMIDKLSESVDEMKEKYDKEVSEKKYLQSCLDETGNLLFHLRNNEKKLQEEKGTLEEDLESEMQQKESLQESLRRTVSEHKSLVDKLQSMNSTHVNVQESLKEASKKEENYQQQIEDLTRTNYLMHYMLEKEKEERYDLQELYDGLEVNYRKLKRETTEEMLHLNQKVDSLTESNAEMKETKEQLEKMSTDLRTSLEQEEEDNIDLRKTISRNEQHKEKLEKEAQFLRERREELEKEIVEMKKKIDETQKSLRRECDKSESLSNSLESREELINKISNDLSSARGSVHEKDKEISDLSSTIRDKGETVSDLTRKLEVMTKDRDQLKERLQESEKESKLSQKACMKYKNELEKLEFEHANLEKERDMLRRSVTDRTNDMELHKSKSNESVRQLREEIADLHTKLIEKDRAAMKQKESYQDAIDNTNADLALLRQFIGDEFYPTSPPNEADVRCGTEERSTEEEPMEIDIDAIDVDFLRNVHQQFESEMQSHVDNLEGMLHISKQKHDSVTVIQSPMSKIKLEEIKELRDETFELRSEVKGMIGKLNSVMEDVMIVKLSISGKDQYVDEEGRRNVLHRTNSLENELLKLDEAISKIEARHKSIVRRNSSLIDYARRQKPSPRVAAKADDGNSTDDDEDRQKLDKEIMMLTLREENARLKTFVNFVNKKLKLSDGQLMKTLSGKQSETEIEPEPRRPYPEARERKLSSQSDRGDYYSLPRASGSLSDRSKPNLQQSYVRSKSARTSPTIERSSVIRSFSGRSSPVSEGKFRPISPVSSRVRGYTSNDESDGTAHGTKYGRSTSEQVQSKLVRGFPRGRADYDFVDDVRREGYRSGSEDESLEAHRQRRQSRRNERESGSSSFTKRPGYSNDGDGYSDRSLRRRGETTFDRDYDSKNTAKKGYSFLGSEVSMYQYQNSQGSKMLRQKLNDRYRSVDGSSERQGSGYTDSTGSISSSTHESQYGNGYERRSRTLPRTKP